MSSGTVIKALLRADGVDRLSITVCPESGAVCLLYDWVRSS
jgi:hypothetical protein